MNTNLRIIDLLGRTEISKWYHFVKESQYWSQVDIQAWQNEKLHKIVEHAYNNVPYYQKLFKELKLKPADIKITDDLTKLPVIRRKDLQNNYSQLIANNHKQHRPQYRSTGGTTGEPVRYLSDINTWSLHWALKFRALESSGYQIGDKIAVMGGTSVIPEVKASLARKVWNRLNSLYPLPTSHMRDEILATYVNLILTKNIRCLRGYPSSIAVFARYCSENKIKLDIPHVITTAEVLQPLYRDEIKKAFDPVLIDSYGCADGGGSANTCPAETGFHLSLESAVWEVCTPTGSLVNPNETGEVTLTSLTNYAMPLLRYQPGDVIENTFDYSLCSCGCTLPRIKRILGRTMDILHFHNGISLGGPAFNTMLRNFPLTKWQMIQNDMISLDINIIPSKEYDSASEKEICRLLHYHCGEGVAIRLHKVTDIPISSSGKQRVIINNTNR
ncbi:MAG: phenylacetate--CoA ligase family protein [Mangrovibacterium sp.]